MGDKITAKQYLEQLKLLDEMISQDLEQLEDMKSQASNIRGFDYSQERVQVSRTGDSLCKSVSKYVDFNNEISNEIERFSDIRNRIIEEIRSLHVANYICVLFKIYVQYKTVKIAANEMNLSYSYVVELHKKALKEFDKTYQNLQYLT